MAQPLAHDIRDTLVDRLVKIVAVGGALAYVPSVVLAVKYELWLVVAADTVALGVVSLFALVSAIPPRVKIASVVALAYALGLALLLWTGPTGAGHLFVFAFVFLSVLFYGNRGMVGANAVAILTHGALVAFSALGWVGWEQGLDSVIVISVNYVLVSLLLTGSVQFLLQGYHRSAQEERRQREVTELLLHEIEHRSKNNLQVISSLVSLRSRGGQTPEDALSQIRDSLSAMASVQHLLFRENNEYLVRLPDLMASLMDRFATLHRPIAFTHQWTGNVAVVRSEVGVSLGLLLNEIVMNAVRHAFADPSAGRVTVEAHYDADRLVLVVADNGRGRGAAPAGTGTSIIEALARQLSAKLTLEDAPGTRYRLEMAAPLT